jgi:hypothetical protein
LNEFNIDKIDRVMDVNGWCEETMSCAEASSGVNWAEEERQSENG